MPRSALYMLAKQLTGQAASYVEGVLELAFNLNAWENPQ
jgi:hypothetical protein